MTSDAKIGLLLGLVFIFLIALVINGLPSFCGNSNNNELTANMVGLQNNPPVIAAKERDVINLRELVRKKHAAVEHSSAASQNIQPAQMAPERPLVIKETIVEQVIADAAQAVAKEDEDYKTTSSKVIPPKTYVVEEGDSLAGIAQKFYGSQEGNRRINVSRIFNANRKVLKSPDEIYVGQKLIIPPLSASMPDKGKTADIFPEKQFAKVESIGSRQLLTNTRRPEQSSWHVVRQGDSLWQIAAARLGDGSRYDEIAELNAGILDSEDNLSVGMRLRMPAR